VHKANALSDDRAAKPDGWTLDKVHALFPRLAERGGSSGSQLSGG